MSSQRIRVSVIVPTHNSPDQATECLTALRASAPEGVELIAVDDASTDRTPEVLAALSDRVVRLERNSGPAVARNAGADVASGEILLFVDQDVVVAPEVIDRVARTFERRPDLGALFGSYDAAPRAPGVVSQFRNLLHHYVHQIGDPEASTFWAGCGAVRREVFQSVGGFTPHIELEDVELGYRLRCRGHRILLDRELQVKHLKTWTLRSMTRTDIAARALPWARLVLTTGNAPEALNLRPEQRWSVALTGAAVALAVGSPAVPLLIPAAGVLVIAVTALNFGFHRFLWNVRGPRFVLASIPLHLLYFTCCGMGALWALATTRRGAARQGA